MAPQRFLQIPEFIDSHRSPNGLWTLLSIQYYRHNRQNRLDIVRKCDNHIRIRKTPNSSLHFVASSSSQPILCDILAAKWLGKDPILTLPRSAKGSLQTCRSNLWRSNRHRPRRAPVASCRHVVARPFPMLSSCKLNNLHKAASASFSETSLLKRQDKKVVLTIVKKERRSFSTN